MGLVVKTGTQKPVKKAKEEEEEVSNEEVANEEAGSKKKKKSKKQKSGGALWKVSEKAFLKTAQKKVSVDTEE